MNGRLFLDGEQDILQPCVILVDVMDIVCRHEFGLVAAAHFDQGLVDLRQFRDIVFLQLQVKIICSENLVVPIQLLASCIQAFSFDQTGYLG